jgi:DNA-binding NtrC family response regulator
MTAKLCLIEDDPIMGESLCDRFALEGLAYDWHITAGAALQRIGREPYAAVISDIRLPDLSGEEVFSRLLAQKSVIPPFLFITGYGAVDRAVEMLKLGAADYITKPFDIEQLIEKVRVLMRFPAPALLPAGEVAALGISPQMRRIEEMLPRIAAHAETVLITGESGVGKERVAQLLHRLRDPADERPFVAVNCAALSESLLEAELFGYEKGAFTGALRTKKGLFEQAESGTLFLDEIGEMPPSMQVKLLRAIQERRVTRVGGEKSLPVSIRLICATNRDLRELVAAGKFREDLFYRVNVIHLRIPPLRSRREDILCLARAFLADYAAQRPGEAKKLSVTADAALMSHDWPGNIRELKHCIERASILTARPVLEGADLFEDRLGPAEGAADGSPMALADYLQRCERHYILEGLQKRGWQISETALALGISRKSLWERMRRLRITAGDDEPV